MESLAYLHLVLAYEDPTTYEFILGQRIQKFWQQLPWQYCSSRLALRFLFVATTLAILSLTQAAFALLQLNDFGAEVIQLQQQLRQLGYYQRPITKDFDSFTEAAVVRFQRDEGISVDGQVGPETQGRINLRLRAGGFISSTRPVTQNSFNQVSWGNSLPPSNPVPLYSPPGSILPPSLSTVTFQQFSPASPFINRRLKLGDTGVDVELLQSRLTDLSVDNFRFDPQGIDGKYGLNTESAVRNFQFSRNLPETGIADEETLAALGLLNRAGGNRENTTFKPKGYVVVIPSPDSSIAEQVRRTYSNVVVTRNRLGRYAYFGPYSDRFQAEYQSALVKLQFPTARVVYFR